MWSSSNRPYSPYLTQVNESALSAIGCWDAGCPQASKMLEYQKQQTAAAVPRQRQLYKSGGQLEVSWPNWTQKIKGTVKARKFPWVKSLKLCQAAQRWPVFSNFFRHCIHWQPIKTWDTYVFQGLWNQFVEPFWPVVQYHKISQNSRVPFSWVFALLHRCLAVMKCIWRASRTLTHSASSWPVIWRHCDLTNVGI